MALPFQNITWLVAKEKPTGTPLATPNSPNGNLNRPLDQLQQNILYLETQISVATPPFNHQNDLTVLQGGSPAERYHLTVVQHNDLTSVTQATQDSRLTVLESSSGSTSSFFSIPRVEIDMNSLTEISYGWRLVDLSVPPWNIPVGRVPYIRMIVQSAAQATGVIAVASVALRGFDNTNINSPPIGDEDVLSSFNQASGGATPSARSVSNFFVIPEIGSSSNKFYVANSGSGWAIATLIPLGYIT